MDRAGGTRDLKVYGRPLDSPLMHELDPEAMIQDAPGFKTGNVIFFILSRPVVQPVAMPKKRGLLDRLLRRK